MRVPKRRVGLVRPHRKIELVVLEMAPKVNLICERQGCWPHRKDPFLRHRLGATDAGDMQQLAVSATQVVVKGQHVLGACVCVCVCV